MILKIIILTILVIPVSAFSQSSVVIDAGATIHVDENCDISADSKTVNGTLSGAGTWSNGPLPVELISFTGAFRNNKVTLIWNTATEVSNYGFAIESKCAGREWVEIGFLRGNGNSNSPKSYSFTDANPEVGQIMYRLKQIDFDGVFEYSSVIEVDIPAPSNFLVRQNFPNPFNPTTTITYELPEAEWVTVKVFDIPGNEIVTLKAGYERAGYHWLNFDGSNLPSGIYFYRIQSGKYSKIKKMTLQK